MAFSMTTKLPNVGSTNSCLQNVLPKAITGEKKNAPEGMLKAKQHSETALKQNYTGRDKKKKPLQGAKASFTSLTALPFIYHEKLDLCQLFKSLDMNS